MTNSQRLEAIRQHLEAWFATQTDGQPWEASESILIRDGFYCGRCFQLRGFRAVWFFEEDQIKIYRSSGELLETFSGRDALSAPVEEPTLSIDQARAAASTNEPTQEGLNRATTRRAA